MKSGKIALILFMASFRGPNFTSNGVCTAGMLKTWMRLVEDAKAGSNITT
jgi:hypothetical protein